MVTRHYIGIIVNGLYDGSVYPVVKYIRSTNQNTLNNRLLEIVNCGNEETDYYSGYIDVETDDQLRKFDQEIERMSKESFAPLYEWFIKLVTPIRRMETDGELIELIVNGNNKVCNWYKKDYGDKESISCIQIYPR